jgi:putative acetyltransferase
MSSLTVTLTSAPNDTVRLLIAELEDVLAAEYPPENRHGLPLDAIFQPHVRFFVAALDNAPAGCGGVALFDGFAEVKRMYVRPFARGQGVARAILERIEAETRAANLAILRLETGDKQIDALRLYRRYGFTDCPPFGDYADLPPHTISTSVFLEKSIWVHPWPRCSDRPADRAPWRSGGRCDRPGWLLRGGSACPRIAGCQGPPPTAGGR